MTSSARTILLPSRKQWLTLIGGMGLAFACSIFLIAVQMRIGWYFGGFFVLGLLFFSLQLHPKANHIALSSDGFELRYMFRTTKYAWVDIQSMFAAKLGGDDVIAFDFVSSFDKYQRTRRMVKKMCGFEGSFPPIPSMPIDDLLRLVTEYRRGGQNA